MRHLSGQDEARECTCCVTVPGAALSPRCALGAVARNTAGLRSRPAASHRHGRQQGSTGGAARSSARREHGAPRLPRRGDSGFTQGVARRGQAAHRDSMQRGYQPSATLQGASPGTVSTCGLRLSLFRCLKPSASRLGPALKRACPSRSLGATASPCWTSNARSGVRTLRCRSVHVDGHPNLQCLFPK